jgi:hypothetical protein
MARPLKDGSWQIASFCAWWVVAESLPLSCFPGRERVGRSGLLQLPDIGLPYIADHPGATGHRRPLGGIQGSAVFMKGDHRLGREKV